MTFIWLIVWLCKGCPQVTAWNAWLISLMVCAGMDIFAVKR